MDDLNNIAPKLSKISREDPFRVPDGYFENLPDRIQAKIQEGTSNYSASSDSLEILAPKLSKITKEIPFRVPDKYFEKLPDRIQAKIQESTSNDSIEILAPKLTKITKEVPFRVPDGYFEKLPDRIQAKIQEDSSKKSSSSSTIIRILKPVIGLAASIILVFSLVYWPLTRVNQNLTQNDTNVNELDNYYQIISDLDDNTFYSLMQEEYEEDSFTDEELYNYISSSFDEYEIYYLAENLQ